MPDRLYGWSDERSRLLGGSVLNPVLHVPQGPEISTKKKRADQMVNPLFLFVHLSLPALAFTFLVDKTIFKIQLGRYRHDIDEVLNRQ